MNTSEKLDSLAGALSKAQGEITGALKDSANPFFKSKYADLASCWDACRAALSKHGLSIVQGTMVADGNLYLMTRLLHDTGQWIDSQTPVTPTDVTPQAMGSAITYARRYALTAMVGVAQIDDDGNAGSGRETVRQVEKFTPPPLIDVEVARKHALAMIAIIQAPARDGDHDETQKSLEALDYHVKHMAGNHELYQAAAAEMDAAKRNVWKALISKARESEKNEKKVQAAGRKF